MIYLFTFLWAIPSVPLWFMNQEAWVVVQALRGADPILLSITSALGQFVGFTILFFFGDRIIGKVKKIKAKIDKVDMEKYRRSSYLLLILGAITGIPSFTILSLLAGTLKFKFLPYGLICISGRILRFMVLAFAPETFQSAFGCGGG